MKAPQVSIIVPVYNTGRLFLTECIDSIISQSLKEIEVVLINDASPNPEDETVCLEYVKKDSRVKYHQHEHNTGVGGARNTGIAHANGEYIGWVDSDDWIQKDMFEKLYLKASETNASLVQCYFTEHHEDKTKLRKLKRFKKKKDSLNVSNVLLWNKLFKKSLFTDNDIKFPHHVSLDDMATMPRLYYFVDHMPLVPEALYHYRVLRSGAVTSNYQKVFKSTPKAFLIIKSFLEEGDFWQQDKLFFEKRVIRSLYHDIKRLSNDQNIDAKEKNTIVREHLTEYLSFLTDPSKINLNEIEKTKTSLAYYKLKLSLRCFIKEMF